ncbi:MAG: hypothetical protein Q7U02_07680 [Desulfosalsimonadaceae bacterium]|nr:hypothetical protein [Desulfosalsimonadaceae bacterium]
MMPFIADGERRFPVVAKKIWDNPVKESRKKRVVGLAGAIRQPWAGSPCLFLSDHGIKIASDFRQQAFPDCRIRQQMNAGVNETTIFK